MRNANRPAAIAIVAAITLALPPGASAGRQSLVEGPITIGALTTQSVKFHVPGEWMTRPRIEGRLIASGGRGKDIEVHVFEAGDLAAWEKGGAVPKLHASARAETLALDVALPGPGAYVVVLSNRFSKFAAKQVAGSLALVWEEDPSLPTGGALRSQVRFVDVTPGAGLELRVHGAEPATAVVLEHVGDAEDAPIAAIVRRHDGEATVTRTVGSYAGRIEEAGAMDVHGHGPHDVFLVGRSADAEGAWRDLVVICPRQYGMVTLSVGQAADGAARLRRGPGFGDARFGPEQSFLERIQSAYGGTSLRSGAPARGAGDLFGDWLRDNRAVRDGPLTIRRLPGEPGDMGPVEARLADGVVTYMAIAGAGVLAYDSATDEHYAVFHPSRPEAWPTALTRSGAWLAIGTRGEGVALVHLATFRLRRVRPGGEADSVRTLEAVAEGVRVNGVATVEVPRD